MRKDQSCGLCLAGADPCFQGNSTNGGNRRYEPDQVQGGSADSQPFIGLPSERLG